MNPTDSDTAAAGDGAAVNDGLNLSRQLVAAFAALPGRCGRGIGLLRAAAAGDEGKQKHKCKENTDRFLHVKFIPFSSIAVPDH